MTGKVFSLDHARAVRAVARGPLPALFEVAVTADGVEVIADGVLLTSEGARECAQLLIESARELDDRDAPSR